MHSAILLLCCACRPGFNYTDPVAPRYAGAAHTINAPAHGDTLRIVSFNVEYAREYKKAARVLSTARDLRDADVILLQEMTAPATKFIADSLQMRFVYYPAIYNRIMRRDIGNAILSRWPIVEDSKIILPSKSRYAKTQRISTAATIAFGDRRIRIYSTHFGTPADLGWSGRIAQLQRIIDDAARYPLVVIGGDMNSEKIGQVAEKSGYVWPTARIPKSNSFGRFDHFFIHGLSPAGTNTHPVPRSISDHSPIWIQLVPF